MFKCKLTSKFSDKNTWGDHITNIDNRLYKYAIKLILLINTDRY